MFQYDPEGVVPPQGVNTARLSKAEAKRFATELWRWAEELPDD